MGGACCREEDPVVHVPLPGTLQQWDKLSRANCLMCVSALNDIRIQDARMNMSRLCGPYVVQVVNKTGKSSEIVVKDIAKEVYTVYTMLKDATTKKKGKEPALDDVRRESALCMSNLHILADGRFELTETIDPEFVSSQLEAPLPRQHIIELCNLFEEVNTSRSGAVDLSELGRWVSTSSPSITQSVFFILFTEIVQSDVLHKLRAVEFIAAVDRYCILSRDQLLQHVFFGLADTTTAGGIMAIDILGLMDRFPILTVGGAGDAGKMPLLKTLAKEYNNRLANPADATAEARLVTQEDFNRIYQAQHRAFDHLFHLQDIIKRATLGHRVWNQRRRTVERELDSRGKTRAGLLTKQFTLQDVRAVNSYYTVRPANAEEGGDPAGESKEGMVAVGMGADGAGAPQHSQSYYGGMTDRSTGYKGPAQLSGAEAADFSNGLKSSYSFAGVASAQRATGRFGGNKYGGSYDGYDGRPSPGGSAGPPPRDWGDYNAHDPRTVRSSGYEDASRGGRLLDPDDEPSRQRHFSSPGPGLGVPMGASFGSSGRFDSGPGPAPDRGYDGPPPDRYGSGDDRYSDHSRGSRSSRDRYGSGPGYDRYDDDRRGGDRGGDRSVRGYGDSRY